MAKMTVDEMRAELHSYVELWAEEMLHWEPGVSEGCPTEALSAQALLLPLFADAGVGCDGGNNPYLVDFETGLAVLVEWHVAEKELDYQIDHGSNAQVKRYHDWASAMIARG